MAATSGPPVKGEDSWSDFRETAGVKIPCRSVIARNGRKFANVIITDCKIDSGLELEEMQERP